MADLTDSQTSAFDALRNLFASYGLPTDGDIMDILRQSAINGDSSDLVQIQLQGTASWKQRFQGNEILKSNGGNVLSVAEYLSVENSYRQVMQNAGVPVGFFDSPSDFSQFIGKSIAPTEIQQRVNIASDIVRREDPAIADELARRGLTQGQLIAYALDPTRAQPLIQRDLTAVTIGAAAQNAGVRTSTTFAESLAERGVAEREAAQGFGQVAQIAQPGEKLGQVYGVDYTQGDAEQEIFNNSGEAQRKRLRLANAEKGNFGGSANYGTTKTSSAGQF